jgi:hypothetical protein
MDNDLSRDAMACVKGGALAALRTPALWALGFFYGFAAIFMRAALGSFNDAIATQQVIEMLSSTILFLPTSAAFILSAAGMLAFARRSVFAAEDRPEPRTMGFGGLLLRVLGLIPFYALLVAAVIAPGAFLASRAAILSTLWMAAAWFAAGCFMFLIPVVLTAEAAGIFSSIAKAGAFLWSGPRFYRVLGILMLFMFPARLINLLLDGLAGPARSGAANWALMGLSSLVSGLAASCILATLMMFYLRASPAGLSRPDA